MIRVRWRKLLEWQMEVGIARGVSKAYKHTDDPTREMIAESVEHAVWEAIDEFLVVEDDEYHD